LKNIFYTTLDTHCLVYQIQKNEKRVTNIILYYHTHLLKCIASIKEDSLFSILISEMK